MIPLGVLAASRHATVGDGWHMVSSYNSGGLVDLGPVSPNRHVAIILRLKRMSPTGTAGVFYTVSIGDVPVAFTEVSSGSAGRVVVGVAHVPENGLVTYTNAPHSGGTSLEYITIAAYPGEIAMLQFTGGALWNQSLSFSLNADDGGVGLLAGDLSGLDTPTNLEYFGNNGMSSYAGWEHTTAPTWSKTVSRQANAVGVWCAAILVPTEA